MPLVTRTVIFYIDDEHIEVDIEVEEPLQGNICRLCEKVELKCENDIICPECWLLVEEVDPASEEEKGKEKEEEEENINKNDAIDVLEDDDMSYRSFKEIIRKRNQSEESSEGEDI